LEQKRGAGRVFPKSQRLDFPEILDSCAKTARNPACVYGYPTKAIQERNEMHASEPAAKTSVAVLSDSRLFRETIAARLKSQEEIDLVADADSTHQLRQRINGSPARVLLVHTAIDSALGSELLSDAKTLLPATCLIALAFRQSEQDLDRWIHAGAMAYLDQDVSSLELLETIRKVARKRRGCL
jgi:CheY-like chemotaxis protein